MFTPAYRIQIGFGKLYFQLVFFFSVKVLDGQCLFQTTSADRKKNYPYSNQMKSENYRQTCGFFLNDGQWLENGAPRKRVFYWFHVFLGQLLIHPVFIKLLSLKKSVVFQKDLSHFDLFFKKKKHNNKLQINVNK